MGNQNFNTWWTTYPSTHVRAGQTVEVITREAYDGKVDQLNRDLIAATTRMADMIGETEFTKTIKIR